jgi:hypothetical protein
MKLRIATLLMLLATSTTALASGEAGAGGPPPGMAPGGIMFRAGGMGTIAMAGYDLPSIGFAYLPIDHMMVAVALSFQYNGNGIRYPCCRRVHAPRHHAFCDGASICV